MIKQYTHTLKDIGWFERTPKGLIYLYLSDGSRVRIPICDLRYLAKQNEVTKNGRKAN